MTIEIPLWMQVPTYAARVDRMLFAQLWDEGVMDLTAYKVTQRAAGANFTVDVAVGVAVVTGDDQADQGNYLVRETAVENATITAAPGANSRYDIVCLKVNDPNAGGAAGSNATIVVTAGVVAASPVVPATPVSSLLLAIVGPITSGTASITNAIIADARVLAGERVRPGSIKATANAVAENGWLFCAGQAISRTTYARLFAHISTVYGVGDGSTTFNVPDLRGRVPVGLDNMGGSDAGRLSVANTLGGTGGAQTHTLVDAEMPVHDHAIDHDHGGQLTGSQSANHVHVISHTHAAGAVVTAAGADTFAGASGGAGDSVRLPGAFNEEGSHPLQVTVPGFSGDSGINSGDHVHSVNLDPLTGTSGAAGSDTAHNNMQPYQLLNYLIRT